MTKFFRISSHIKIKLGKGRNSRDRKWRRARGRHNKIREKRKGRMKKVEIGYGQNKAFRGTVNGKKPIFVNNLNDLKLIKKNDLVLIARIGNKKRLEVEKQIKEIGAKILNERRKEK